MHNNTRLGKKGETVVGELGISRDNETEGGAAAKEAKYVGKTSPRWQKQHHAASLSTMGTRVEGNAASPDIVISCQTLFSDLF